MTAKLWGVKRPDGTMIQSRPRSNRNDAVLQAMEIDMPLAAILIGQERDNDLDTVAENWGYTLVRAAVVEVKE